MTSANLLAAIKGADLVPASEILRILDECAAVKLPDEPGSPVTYPELPGDAPDEEDAELVRCSWVNEDQDFEVVYPTRLNEHGWVNYGTGTMWLHDDDGDLCEIAVLNRRIDKPTKEKTHE